MDACKPIEYEHRQTIVKGEHIIAYKIHDSCRYKNCLTHTQLGPALVPECCLSSKPEEDTVIRPPRKAVAVTIDELKVKKMHVLKKRPSPSHDGCWDVTVSLVFEYLLTFLGVSGCVISTVEANNIYILKAKLRGPKNSDLVMTSDLCGELMAVTPFIWSEASAIALDGEIYRSPSHDCRDEVRVKIGLCCIIKLIGSSSLEVKSKGFFIPEECDAPTDPCEYFETLDFIADIL